VKECTTCNLPVRGIEAEGDRPICLTCLASLRPHTTYHEQTFNYSTIEGCIRQSLDLPLTDDEQSSSKASECDESEANKEKDDETK